MLCLVFFLFFFLMRPLYSRVNKRFPVRKAGEVLKGQKGACCSHVGRRGPAAAIFWEGNNLRSHEELIHLHLPSQPAPGAGRTTHNTPQMSLSSRVHQLKLINIPPHAGDVLPAQRAAGQATAEHNKGSRSSGSGALGSRCTWLGAGKGTVWSWHCSSLIMQAELSCLQMDGRGDVVGDRAEHTAVSAQRNANGVPCWSVGCHSQWGEKYPSYHLTHTLSR